MFVARAHAEIRLSPEVSLQFVATGIIVVQTRESVIALACLPPPLNSSAFDVAVNYLLHGAGDQAILRLNIKLFRVLLASKA